MRIYVFRGFLIVIIAAMAICMYKMIEIHNIYVHEEQTNETMAEFAPLDTVDYLEPKESEKQAVKSEDEKQPEEQEQEQEQEPSDPETEEPKPVEQTEEPKPATPDPLDMNRYHPEAISGSNPSILEAQNNINEDITAWLRVPDTKIDYPVLHGTDNSFYLNHNVQKKPANAGSIFIDSRNNKGFIDFNTIIYGHNMINGSMFGDLLKFNDSSYFSNNPTARLFLPDATYNLEIFAFMNIKQDDRIIYGSAPSADFTEFFEYVRTNALYYRDVGLSDQDRIVTLSTCASDLADARMVLLAKLRDTGELEF